MSANDADDPDVRVEVGEPFCLDGGEWICVAKLVGRGDDEDSGEASEEPVPTHTMFLAQGHGRSAEEAVRDALRQIEQVSSVPAPRIHRRSSIPPEPRRGRSSPPIAVQAQATVPPPSSNPPPEDSKVIVAFEPPPQPRDAGALKWLSRLFGRNS